MINNIFFTTFQTATNLQMYLRNWNMPTTRWLRYVCYTRVRYAPQFSTFLLSGVWHGCHIGYFVALVGGFMHSVAEKKVRDLLQKI